MKNEEELKVDLTKDDEEEIDEYTRLLTLDELSKIFGGLGGSGESKSGDERETIPLDPNYINKQIFGSKFQ